MNVIQRTFLLIVLAISIFDMIWCQDELCSVYDPFRIQPDDNKYQIGGVFPLHQNDCKRLNPDAVQDIIAIQWALTHWNQNPKNSNMKTGLFAGDTCSRPKEALSQILRYLNTLGFHEPYECATAINENDTPKLLGLFIPKDGNSAVAVATLLQSTPLPMITYSSQSADSLSQLKLPNLISTAPTFATYIDAFIRFMKDMDSDLVTIVSSSEDEATLSRVIAQLRSNGIYLENVLNYDQINFGQVLSETESQLVLLLMPYDKLAEVLAKNKLNHEKTWVAVSLDGYGSLITDKLGQSRIDPDLQIIYLRHQQRELAQFMDYYLRVLKNNYHSYSLLTALVQQTFNCSLTDGGNYTDCGSVTAETMATNYKQADTVESSVRAIYALAALAASFGQKPELEITCNKLSNECTDAIMKELEVLVYEFDADDPSELFGTQLYFYRDADGLLMANGIVIEGIELINDDHKQLTEIKVMEYETGLKPRFAMTTPHRKGIRSTCLAHQPVCGSCVHRVAVDQKRFYLSNAKSYPAYLMGLFDFHGGRSCYSYRNPDISLPLAFLHTLTMIRERYPQIDLLQNVDIGPLLVDSCSSGRKAIETVVLSENHCFTVEQGGHNITISPTSIFGYVSALNGRSAEALKGFFVSGESLLVTLDADRDSAFDAFSPVPSRKNEAVALIKLLKKFSWELVSVVLSEQETASSATFHHFENFASENGICIAGVKLVNGEEIDTTTTANVTVLFTTANDAANYFLAKLRTETHHSHVHIVMGDAHDFYLHDPSNVARFVGTLSLQPKDVVNEDFRAWLGLTTPLTLPEQWFWEYVENKWQCALSAANKHLYDNKMCTGDELLDVPSLGRMTKSGYLARGLEHFLLALDAVYKRLCPNQYGLCDQFYEKGREQIVKILKKARVDEDYDIYEFAPNNQGSFGFKKIGNYSMKHNLRFLESYKSFDRLGNIVDSDSPFRIVSRCSTPLCKCFIDMNPSKISLAMLEEAGIIAGSYIRRIPTNNVFQQFRSSSILDRLTAGQWRLQSWNYAMTALITLLVLGAFGVLILAGVKLYLRVIKGNQSLGLSLLVGVIFLCITAYFFVFDPTDMVCRLRIVMHPLSYALCFGVIIAKATQLKNSETLGCSDVVYISYWNYWLLLLFIIGVQIALSSRWLTEDLASVVALNDLKPQLVCKYNSVEFLLSQAYVIILLAMALFINSRNKNIKRNYKETKWLFVASLSCAIIWAIWIMSYLWVSPQYKDTVVALELILCATALLGFIFGPKIYIMVSYEPVVVEIHPQQALKDFFSNQELFEKDDDLKRASSPASSAESASTKSHSTVYSVAYCKNASTSSRMTDNSGDQIPIFRTVVRKKQWLRRSHSADRSVQTHVERQTVHPLQAIFKEEKVSGSIKLDAPVTVSAGQHEML